MGEGGREGGKKGEGGRGKERGEKEKEVHYSEGSKRKGIGKEREGRKDSQYK